MLEGSAEVTQKGKRLAIRKAGDFFGEIALVSDRPRMATVTTLEPSVVLIVTEPTPTPCQEAPEIALKVLQAVGERLPADDVARARSALLSSRRRDSGRERPRQPANAASASRPSPTNGSPCARRRWRKSRSTRRLYDSRSPAFVCSGASMKLVGHERERAAGFPANCTVGECERLESEMSQRRLVGADRADSVHDDAALAARRRRRTARPVRPS